MFRRLTVGCLLTVPLITYATPPIDYYTEARGKSGEELKVALHSILDGHLALRYTESGNDNWQDGQNIDVWEALTYTDAACEHDGFDCDEVVLLYTGNIVSVDTANRGSGGHDTWEREHVWPKSRSFKKPSQDGYTDLHHLRPADRNINNAHSNLGYNVGGESLFDKKSDGTKVRTEAKKDKAQSSFEPPDRAKGQVARMLFYMAVRYEETDNTPDEKMGDLQLIHGNQITKEGKIGDLCTLLEWHHTFGPTDFERRRNDRVAIIQGNRNPFIDEPGWAQLIWGHQC
ncbi:endonuclease [Vibrio sp. ZSDE26]|uniref:Endonuclease n=2 Tax=Vibrio amylolyticus TaxID=2847292 RepID=A0A9X1XIR6_9VIBR|nr:endonuclease [Vibrio amylolyticus]MCK6263777.1 endonuclease [Vibrio amylolyticus]